MSIARRERRAAEKHINKLGTILMDFYAFLEKKPKPSDEEVRLEFIKQEHRWKRYCSLHKLNDRASLLFNQEVAQSWKTRYAKSEEPTTEN